MESANDPINLIECLIIKRNSLLIRLGFFNLKKMYYFLKEFTKMEEIDKEICDINTKIIQLTQQINDFIKQYDQIIEKNNLLMKESDIKYEITKINLVSKIDNITVESLKLYTPLFTSIDIDIISSIDDTSIVIKEKMINIESKFMELNSVELRQRYLKNKILYLSSFSKLNDQLINKYNIELNDNEIKISSLMSQLIIYKDDLPNEIKDDVYMQMYKKSLDFNENYKSFI